MAESHPSMGPVDISPLTRVALDDLGLLAQPLAPIYKGAVVQVFVRKAPYGGPDKSSNGHRYDSAPLANGLIRAGMSCQLIHYLHEEHEKFFQVCQSFDFILLRCSPGQIESDGGEQIRFDGGVRALRSSGVQIWPLPEVVGSMGTSALCCISHLSIGLPDALSYSNPKELEDGFKRTIAFQPRVVKQSGGRCGEGIWIIRLQSGAYCAAYSERTCEDSEVIEMVEACDNHVEVHTVAEFIEFCSRGRTERSGAWASKGAGRYLDAGGVLIDQRFCPRIVEGLLRYHFVAEDVVDILDMTGRGSSQPEQLPKGGQVSVVSDPHFAGLSARLREELPQLMPALGLAQEPLPLWWTIDFILTSPPGTPTDQEQWTVGEFNSGCVCIPKCGGALCTDGAPAACYGDIEAQDLAEADRHAGRVGQKAREILARRSSVLGPVDTSALTRVALDDLGLMRQPREPRYKGAVVQVYVRSAGFVCSDKSNNKHRYDSVPLANGMIKAGMSCQLIHYLPEEHEKFFEVCEGFDFLLVRCSKGQIESDGGDVSKFEEGLRGLMRLRIQVWPPLDAAEAMGAKDALCRLATLSTVLEDTLCYSDPAGFAAGFKKTMAFHPRVVKQSESSGGEGMWIVRLRSGNYCRTFGERVCDDDEVLDLLETSDNHSEVHTVAEFVEFCTRGRTERAGAWQSRSKGGFAGLSEAGSAAARRIVDQRFCPRITEGEVRYNMICDEVVSIVHTVPDKAGSAGRGTLRMAYGPDEPRFAALTESFLRKDLPQVMQALGLPSEPLPLWWTADFIPTSPPGTPLSEEQWTIGELNCSCVGLPDCSAAMCKDDEPRAGYASLAPEDRASAARFAEAVGRKALDLLQNRCAKPPLPAEGSPQSPERLPQGPERFPPQSPERPPQSPEKAPPSPERLPQSPKRPPQPPERPPQSPPTLQRPGSDSARSHSRGGGHLKVVLLCHGESTWDAQDMFTGWSDVDLSDRGKDEAVEAGRLLKEHGFKFDIVFTSVLRRAIRTAWTALMESENFSMPIMNSWRLNEQHYGGLQGLTRVEAAAKHGEQQVELWHRSYALATPAIHASDPRHPANDPLYRHLPRAALPGGESLRLTVERVLPYLLDTILPCVMAGKRVLLVAHGSSLRAVCKYVEGASEEAAVELEFPTGVPVVCELDGDLKLTRRYYLMDPGELAERRRRRRRAAPSAAR